ncbi:hypothetical protein PLESTB_001377100 [Pleodorina starrii]|uniref:Protochlorophyllide reductase n=1 Tax=Pleodorina starrii TaxID=330485 RepID=A0A9W6BUU1_9CHLO|nr:hypothetical protein PLESTM_000408000 [Pleodorina starrii]GLC58583.1 hypothetical protein PLESTB_001377100 [Pleodorina starrii]GLC67510.1 hypothetical protein PLESTF_000565300 [Pleodorina starrii]
MVVGRRILITGGNIGIGFEAARQLLQRGHHVVITCRDAAKAQKAVDALSPVAKANGASVESALLDLSSFSSVRRGAAQLLSRHPKLDVLLCNAGVWSRDAGSTPLERTEDGQEVTLQVNHLGHFLLVHLMLPALLAAPAARVVVVSSELHRSATGAAASGAAASGGPPPLASPAWLTLLSAAGGGAAAATPSAPPRPTGFQMYCISKLYNLWFAYHLAALLPPTVKVNAVTPGWVPGTTLGRDMPWLARMAYQYLFPLLPGTTSVPEGGRRVVEVCVGEAEGEVTGAYFSRGARAESSPESHNRAAAEELWRLSEAAAGLQGPYVPTALPGAVTTGPATPPRAEGAAANAEGS